MTRGSVIFAQTWSHILNRKRMWVSKKKPDVIMIKRLLLPNVSAKYPMKGVVIAATK